MERFWGEILATNARMNRGVRDNNEKCYSWGRGVLSVTLPGIKTTNIFCKMEELNELELTLLNGLTTKYPSIKSHIPNLKVAQREITGVGMYVHFEYKNFNFLLEDINALFSNEEKIEIKNLKHGLGYVIDITDGAIKYIEFVTYGENWDGKLNEYKIV